MGSKHKSKSESKKHKKKNPKEQDAAHHLSQFGVNMKDVSTTIVTALVSEVITSAIDRLTQSASNSNRDGLNQKNKANIDSLDDDFDNSVDGIQENVIGDSAANDRADHPNPVKAAKQSAKDSFTHAKPLLQEALQAIKDAVSETTPNLSGTLNTLKDKTDDSKQSVGTMVRSAVDVARQVLRSDGDGTVMSGAIGSLVTNAIDTIQAREQSDLSPKQEKSGKKKDKKKNKKKKKKS